jgi:hypothetical protein
LFCISASCWYIVFFGAIIQEKKINKIIWNVPYDFNNSDFAALMKLMSTYLATAYLNKDPQIS